MTKAEMYISTDVETNGAIPGIHAMLSLASVAFDEEGKEHYPREWFDNLTLTHRAIDDARMQGRMFINMKKYNERLSAVPSESLRQTPLE